MDKNRANEVAPKNKKILLYSVDIYLYFFYLNI